MADPIETAALQAALHMESEARYRPVAEIMARGEQRRRRHAARLAGGTALGLVLVAGAGWSAFGGADHHLSALGAAGVGDPTTAKSPTLPAGIPVGKTVPDNGAVVGVGQPISITFAKPVTDKAAVERSLTVEATPAVTGTWHWFGDQRVDFRPPGFWAAGSTVTLHRGIESGAAQGHANDDVTFKVSQHSTVTTVDVAAHTMTVKQDGRVLQTIPITAGKTGFDTWNGTMVVLRKFDTVNSKPAGIFGDSEYNMDVHYAVQLTTSGTFVYAAPWLHEFGVDNVSRGGIEASVADAKWFYDIIGVGDPVTVINSKQPVTGDNGYGDWNMSWADWAAGSAAK
jgi:lipoprotein-anchoring transpeptidase ErfK/SrfK